MKAMIFAAGLGTRLRPLTNDRPKALVEVAGVTMLERVIRHVADAGFHDIVINVHHFGEKIIDFLKENRNFGLNIAVSDEREQLLDTGGGILKARRWLDGDEPFLVHNADILTTLDLRAMYDYHVAHNAMATLLVKDRETQRYFVFDRERRLRGWINKATGETRPDSFAYDESAMQCLAFGGVHVISPQIFPHLQRYAAHGAKFSIAPFYYNECHRLIIKGYVPADDYSWLDVGKPETLATANELFNDRQV